VCANRKLFIQGRGKEAVKYGSGMGVGFRDREEKDVEENITREMAGRAKIRQNAFSAWAAPRTPLGKLTMLPRPL